MGRRLLLALCCALASTGLASAQMPNAAVKLPQIEYGPAPSATDSRAGDPFAAQGEVVSLRPLVATSRAGTPGKSDAALGAPVSPAPALGAPVNLGIVQAGGQAADGDAAPAKAVQAECGAAWSGGCPKCYRAGECFWMQGEVLLWWLRPGGLPPLVTTSPAGTPETSAGVLGTSGTSVLVGDQSVNGGVRAGVRATVGAWLDCDAHCGIEGYFLALNGQGRNFALTSGGDPILARPVLNAATGLPDAQLVAFPGVVSGSVAVSSHSGGLLGAGALFRHNLCCTPCTRLDALVGYRFLRYDDDLNVDENLTPVGPLFVPGTNILVSDRFSARNEFHGADLGLEAQRRRGPWSVDLLAKVALGNLRRDVTIDGTTVTSVPGVPSVVNTGGLLAQSSNIGRFRSDTFTAVPELGLNVGYQVTPRARLYVGYTLLWLPDMARAADQVDLTVNPGLIPPATGPALPARPRFEQHDTGIWVQGLNFGMAFRF
jgi:Putative beta barrel porin-7 (BBP7)